jgi:hypothetical protein
MLYYWWLWSILTPMVALDMLLRASPLYLTAWPLGLDHLAKDY